MPDVTPDVMPADVHAAPLTPSGAPRPGDIVHVRARQYLVEGVEPPIFPGDATLVRLSCLEDDAQGDRLELLWEREIDARRLDDGDWRRIASRGFDAPRLFSAYLHTLRWGCVTATDAKLFQAPYRAGIEVKAYQLEPLRRALGRPRVNLFIADDVGLGKTIEAGLILRELLMRQKVRRVVVCVPPSVVRQWQEELDERFGLPFVIYDRDYVAQVRQERGWTINPWSTHNRFIISHALIRDERYAAPLREWLRDQSGGAMLILDEAHNVAPASGSKYAVDSKLTRAVRDLAPRFEHRLFLSATPHNGHSNSFSALLELLDPQRFVRGVPVDAKLRDSVMVRRLKSDLRALGEPFPERHVRRVVIANLHEESAELVLSRGLEQYRRLRLHRLANATKAQQAAAMLVITSLQKRLLSSIEAFARTLAVHERSMVAHQWANGGLKGPPPRPTEELDLPLLRESPGPDDEHADLDEDALHAEEEAQVVAATRLSVINPRGMDAELGLLTILREVAEAARAQMDPRVFHLLRWVKKHQLRRAGAANAYWNNRRLLIFTEYADTKRYLYEQISTAVAHSNLGHARVMTYHGGLSEERREEIKAAFNADPEQHPVRILIATDAAREGVNLQNHCYDLFHFDVPWNPGRLEQRNGRLDRKLQKSDDVYCHYFVLPQRAEHHVLDVLMQKTRKIHEQLGSLSPVIERRIDAAFRNGIAHDQADALADSLEQLDEEDDDGSRVTTIRQELGHQDDVDDRRDRLERELEELRVLLGRSQEWIGLDDRHLRDALSASLECMGAEGLTPVSAEQAAADPARACYTLPNLHERAGADPSWAATLDALRAPRRPDQSPAEWRRDAPIRPVVFRDPGDLNGEVVHLHLEHRVVQRLLGRFVSLGFRDDDIRRACVLRTDATEPMVVLLGRLSLFGDGGARLHDEVLAAAAPWVDPDRRARGALRPLGEADKADVLRMIEDALTQPRLCESPETLQARLKSAAALDIAALHPPLQRRAKARAERAEKDLTRRAEAEAVEMTNILRAQRERIVRRQAELEESGRQQALDFNPDEARQLESDRKHWLARLVAIAQELQDEPERVRRSYVVKATRVEPVGLVYLWPLSS